MRNLTVEQISGDAKHAFVAKMDINIKTTPKLGSPHIISPDGNDLTRYLVGMAIFNGFPISVEAVVDNVAGDYKICVFCSDQIEPLELGRHDTPSIGHTIILGELYSVTLYYDEAQSLILSIENGGVIYDYVALSRYVKADKSYHQNIWLTDIQDFCFMHGNLDPYPSNQHLAPEESDSDIFEISNTSITIPSYKDEFHPLKTKEAFDNFYTFLYKPTLDISTLRIPLVSNPMESDTQLISLTNAGGFGPATPVNSLFLARPDPRLDYANYIEHETLITGLDILVPQELLDADIGKAPLGLINFGWRGSPGIGASVSRPESAAFAEDEDGDICTPGIHLSIGVDNSLYYGRSMGPGLYLYGLSLDVFLSSTYLSPAWKTVWEIDYTNYDQMTDIANSPYRVRLVDCEEETAGGIDYYRFRLDTLKTRILYSKRGSVFVYLDDLPAAAMTHNTHDLDCPLFIVDDTDTAIASPNKRAQSYDYHDVLASIGISSSTFYLMAGAYDTIKWGGALINQMSLGWESLHQEIAISQINRYEDKGGVNLTHSMPGKLVDAYSENSYTSYDESLLKLTCGEDGYYVYSPKKMAFEHNYENDLNIQTQPCPVVKQVSETEDRAHQFCFTAFPMDGWTCLLSQKHTCGRTVVENSHIKSIYDSSFRIYDDDDNLLAFYPFTNFIREIEHNNEIFLPFPPVIKSKTFATGEILVHINGSSLPVFRYTNNAATRLSTAQYWTLTTMDAN